MFDLTNAADLSWDDVFGITYGFTLGVEFPAMLNISGLDESAGDSFDRGLDWWGSTT